MISASKTTFILNDVKILRPKVMQNLTNLLKKFSEFPPCGSRIRTKDLTIKESDLSTFFLLKSKNYKKNMLLIIGLEVRRVFFKMQRSLASV